MRLVLDTNIVVAGLLWTGPPRRLLDRAIDSAHTLYSSPALIDELAHTLRYQKFVQRIGQSSTSALGLVAQYSALVTLLSPLQVPRVIAHDADDDQVIAAAVAAQADLIVSGDRKHLLPLGSHEGIPIVDASQALRLLGE
jgi:putative PIN family toxin of toxin-antitoxin system